MTSSQLPASNSEEALNGIHDARFRSRLLESFISQFTLSKNNELIDPNRIFKVIEMIRRHKLLQDVYGKDVFKNWINPIMELVKNSKIQNRWIGSLLIGVTCQECSNIIFSENVLKWLDELYLLLKNQKEKDKENDLDADSAILLSAICSSLSDLIIRFYSIIQYGEYSKLKEKTIELKKLSDWILKTIKNQNSFAWSEAIDLLHILLQYFPFSLRKNLDNLEIELIIKMFDNQCGILLRNKCCDCYVNISNLIDNSSKIFFQKLLFSIHKELDYIFSGFESSDISKSVYSKLIFSENSIFSIDEKIKKNKITNFFSIENRFIKLFSLFYILKKYLSTPSPKPINIPIACIMDVIKRLFLFDGSFEKQTFSNTSFFHLNNNNNFNSYNNNNHLFIISQTYNIHSEAFDLLFSLLTTCKSRMLLHCNEIFSFLKKWLSDFSSNVSLKIKYFKFMSHCIIMVGIGIFQSPLIKPLLENIKNELSSFSFCMSEKNNAYSSPFMQNTINKKRKMINNDEYISNFDHNITNSHNNIKKNNIFLQLSVLEVVQSLYVSGMSLLDDKQREELDDMVATSAKQSFDLMEDAVLSKSLSERYADSDCILNLSLSACKSLLASILSPSNHRPPHLSMAMSLFVKGRQYFGTELSQFCSFAILSLEPVLHPRSLPALSPKRRKNHVALTPVPLATQEDILLPLNASLSARIQSQPHVFSPNQVNMAMHLPDQVKLRSNQVSETSPLISNSNSIDESLVNIWSNMMKNIQNDGVVHDHHRKLPGSEAMNATNDGDRMRTDLNLNLNLNPNLMRMMNSVSFPSLSNNQMVDNSISNLNLNSNPSLLALESSGGLNAAMSSWTNDSFHTNPSSSLLSLPSSSSSSLLNAIPITVSTPSKGNDVMDIINVLCSGKLASLSHNMNASSRTGLDNEATLAKLHSSQSQLAGQVKVNESLTNLQTLSFSDLMNVSSHGGSAMDFVGNIPVLPQVISQVSQQLSQLPVHAPLIPQQLSQVSQVQVPQVFPMAQQLSKLSEPNLQVTLLEDLGFKIQNLSDEDSDGPMPDIVI